jgi:hypothetical protein
VVSTTFDEGDDVAGNRVLLIGLDPRRVPGIDASLVETAIAMGDARLRQHGFDPDYCLVAPDALDEQFTEALQRKRYDCVVVGGGIRKSEQFLELFERVVNLIRLHASQAVIVFNTTGENSVDAVMRWLPDATT